MDDLRSAVGEDLQTAGDVHRLDLRLEATAESVGQARAQLVAFAKDHECANPQDVALAVTEAVTNAVVHAYRGAERGLMRVVACARPADLLVVVRDYGCGMSPNPDSPGAGLGLSVIGALAAEMNIERPDDGGTRLRIRFPPASAGGATA
jgi:serine/threonine-protein kinase RsbW/stage II sporulation protein AB (anti-sigma F factor)